MRPVFKVLFFAVLLWLAAITAAAQSAAPATKPTPDPKYDKTTESVVKGTVDEVRETPGAKGPDVHLMLKTGGDVLEVCLCPGKFLKEIDVQFAKGDQLEITGSKVKKDDKTIMLARAVVKGNNTLTLRDKEGGPVWTWIVKD